MKTIILVLLTVSSSLIADTYLGGAYNVYDCKVRANARGFQYGVYGAGYDDNGVYYPYFNACFGRNAISPTPSAANRYDVYARAGEDLQSCASNIEWEVNGLTCRVNDSFIQCKSVNTVNKVKAIQQVSCVQKAYVTSSNR